jgi:hypothetical protein
LTHTHPAQWVLWNREHGDPLKATDTDSGGLRPASLIPVLGPQFAAPPAAGQESDNRNQLVIAFTACYLTGKINL